MENSITICNKAAKISNDFERNNSNLKRMYLVHNIKLYNHIVKKVEGFCGSFGTGYPFYALKKDLTGKLPIIDEQIRYNDELITTVEKSKNTIWSCSECLQNGNLMPDLKQICKPCHNIEDALKPRRILTRLPDVNMWMVCEENCIDIVKEELIYLFNKYNLRSSDIDPIQTIYDISEINDDITEGRMPEKLLPVDANIISYSELYSLIEQVPSILQSSIEKGEIPYLPISPLSYRKNWQYDDTPYNFIHDYLSSLTEFHFNDDLNQILMQTRNTIANNYPFELLYYYLTLTGPESVKKRHKSLELKDRFRERITSWKEL